MLLYNAPNPAPNPRRVRIFAAEKGISLELRNLDFRAREHKAPEFTALNPRGQVPSLQLDDGTVISESVAICRYLDAVQPDPPLFGTTPLEIATIDMWNRRVETVAGVPLGNVWVHTHPLTAFIPGRIAEWGEANRPRVADAFAFFDTALSDREYLAGGGFSIADILLLTTVDFARFVGCGPDESLRSLTAWHERVSARPSASA